MSSLDLVQQFGLPIGGLIVVLILGWRGVWVWGQALTECEERNEAIRADYERRLAEQRTAHVQREEELRRSTEQWQRLFFELVPELKGLTEVLARKEGRDR